MLKDFKEGQQVVWDPKACGTEDISTGVVRGFASVELPVMGAMTIIEVLPPGGAISETYPYSCIVLPEASLRSI